MDDFTLKETINEVTQCISITAYSFHYVEQNAKHVFFFVLLICTVDVFT